jgi:hypothetical protein
MPNFKLKLVFTDGEKKVFDCGPYLNTGIFTELKERQYFERVFILDGTVAWPHGQDFCPDTLYIESQ